VSLSSPLAPIPRPIALSGHSTDRPDRLPGSQPGSQGSQASQSGVRISLRGSNVSAEGLLDGSSSDNSRSSKGVLLHPEV